MIVGYPQKAGIDATVAIGSTKYAMYTQNDGAWVKNAAEEAQMVEPCARAPTSWSRRIRRAAPRPPTPIRSRASAQALDKVAQECK